MSTSINKNGKTLIVSVAIASFAALGLVSASTVMAAQTNGPTASATATHDFTKLSHAGTRTILDVVLARSALFDGHPDQATRALDDAQKAMKFARKDDTAYLKAESKLVDPTNSTHAQTSAAPIAWLPVGGDVVVQDDFASQPEKAKAVASANAALKKGDRDGAIKALKLANVNVAFNVDVVPLDQTSARIDQAAALLNAGKYYEAGQVMHHVQQSLRLDELDIDAVPAAAHS